MRILNKTLLIAALVAAAGTASADDGKRAVFRYHTDQPVEDIYAGFRATAHRACRSDSRILRIRFLEQKTCEARMLDQAIRQAAMPELAALHRHMTEPPQPARLFAAKEK